VQSSYVHKEWPSISRQSSTAYLDEFPPVAATRCSHPPLATSETLRSSEASTSGYQVKVKKTPKKPVIGTSRNQHIKSVTTTRCVDVFVSRLHPLTSDNELLDCANETAATHNVKPVEVLCSKLKSKYLDLYACFHVTC